MKVRMRTRMSGTRDGVDWPAPGGEIDLPADEAAMLIANQMAEPLQTGQVESAAIDTKPSTRKP